jgi:hypothetical protein
MSVLEAFGIASGILSIVMFVPYVRDILRHTTKPQRATWIIWTVLGCISFASQWAKGATDSLWLTGGQTLGVFVVFALAFPYGTGGLARRDIFSLVAAFSGLVLWYFTKEPLAALMIVIIIDVLGGWLTVLKAYEHPESETLITWILSATSGVLGAIAVGSLNYALLLYPVYLALINGTIAVSILLGRSKKHAQG